MYIHTRYQEPAELKILGPCLIMEGQSWIQIINSPTIVWLTAEGRAGEM